MFEVRAFLVMLESMRLVSGRQDPDASRVAPRRAYVVTDEGRRKARTVGPQPADAKP